MARVEFPSNSHKDQDRKKREESTKLDPVTTGKVQRKDKSGAEKAAESLFAKDFRDAKDYVVKEIVEPRLKHTLVDAANNLLGMIVLGDDWTPIKGSSGSRSSGTRISYDRISKSDDHPVARARRSVYDYQYLIFETRNDAEAVLDTMCDKCEAIGYVTVGDMYDAAGEQTSYTDFDWGWSRLGAARIIRKDDGWMIDLPRPEPMSRR